jgi:hypothetical protein
LRRFPALTTTQLNAIPAGDNILGTVPGTAVGAAANRTAAQLEQTNGLQTCLNQWNDYAPSLIRSVPEESRRRQALGPNAFRFPRVRGHYVYAAYQQADRHVTTSTTRSISAARAITRLAASPRPHLPADRNALINPRTVNTGLGFTFNPPAFPDGCFNCTPVVAGTGTTQTTTGCGVASDMSNVVVDDTTTSPRSILNDGNANIDAINQELNIDTWNWQTGAASNVTIQSRFHVWRFRL